LRSKPLVTKLTQVKFIFHENEAICLDMFFIDAPLRNKGIGSTLLLNLCAYADKQNKWIYLTPEKLMGTTSLGRLYKFYKSFGFVQNQGINKDFRTTHAMYRKPSNFEP